MELPTPSSTSKLEKVQPIEESGMAFSSAPRQQPDAQNLQANRYQAAPSEEEVESSGKYSSAYSGNVDAAKKSP